MPAASTCFKHRWIFSSTTEPFPGSLNCLQDWLTVASIPIPSYHHETIPSTTELFQELKNCCQHSWTISSITEQFSASLNRLLMDEMISNVEKTVSVIMARVTEIMKTVSTSMKLFPVAERKIFVSNWGTEKIYNNHTTYVHCFLSNDNTR